MKETNQLRNLMETVDIAFGVKQLTEGLLDDKISKLEHAKRLGSHLATDNERVLEILLDNAELSPDFVRLINDAVDECIDTRRRLSKII